MSDDHYSCSTNTIKSNDADILAMAVEMTHVHNVVLRGMNSIYLQCQHISKPSDITDFVKYIRIWGDAVHHHHYTEETHVFPQWDEIARAAGTTESITSENIEQHHAFEVGFEELRKYATDVQEGKLEYDGKKITAIMDSFGPILNEHLHDEIKMILSMDKYGNGATVKKILDDAAQEGLATADPVRPPLEAAKTTANISKNATLPLMFGCVDKTIPTVPGTADWPPVPFYLSYMNHLWFTRKHQSIWRFNPCDNWGRPRPLPFLGPAYA